MLGNEDERQLKAHFIHHNVSYYCLEYRYKANIEIDKNQHIEDKYGIYMNHSFYPNCKIHSGHIVCIKNINIGDELTFNYNDNETNMACPFIDTITKQKVSGKSN